MYCFGRGSSLVDHKHLGPVIKGGLMGEILRVPRKDLLCGGKY